MTESPPILATVVRVDARQCEVQCDGSDQVQAALMRGRLWEGRQEDKVPVAVGDRVEMTRDGDDLAIDRVLERRNVFARRAAGEDVRRQLLAANVDQLVIVSCFGTPPFSSITTDRILAAASFADIPVCIVLNKVDRAKPSKIEQIAGTYQHLEMDVLLTSAETGQGTDELAERLTNKLSVLYGLSGVGKSSLLNCVEDELGIRTSHVSESLQSGRHTTTFARLYPLKVGGGVIDTPGARTFRPYGIPPHELRLLYPELELYGPSCRFPSCLHRTEPKCEVQRRLEQGDIAPSRMRSYLELLAELEKHSRG